MRTVRCNYVQITAYSYQAQTSGIRRDIVYSGNLRHQHDDGDKQTTLVSAIVGEAPWRTAAYSEERVWILTTPQREHVFSCILLNAGGSQQGKHLDINSRLQKPRIHSEKFY